MSGGHVCTMSHTADPTMAGFTFRHTKNAKSHMRCTKGRNRCAARPSTRTLRSEVAMSTLCLHLLASGHPQVWEDGSSRIPAALPQMDARFSGRFVKRDTGDDGMKAWTCRICWTTNSVNGSPVGCSVCKRERLPSWLQLEDTHVQVRGVGQIGMHSFHQR